MTQKDFVLDEYEQEIYDYMEKQDISHLPPMENEAEFIKELQQAIVEKYSKKRPISLRPLEHDILLIQEKARKE